MIIYDLNLVNEENGFSSSLGEFIYAEGLDSIGAH